MIIDHLSGREHLCDICIVGSGPVGMSMALEFDRLGHEVLVLESGGAEAGSRSTEDSRAIIVNPQTHAPMEIAVCRTLGGTSWTWGGRCVPFDDIDFAERDYVPCSTWPINHAEIKSWYAKAAEYLLCGNDKFESQPVQLPPANTALSIACLERWATESRIALIHRERIARSERITLCLNSTVVDLEFDRSGHSVEGLVVAKPDGTRTTVKARNVVLATGGVETTRLLLAVQRNWKDHFGGMDGPLGRYYMGHISGKIANIIFDKPEYAASLDFEKDAARAFTRRRFTLTAEAQMQHRLMNTAFWPDNPPFYDHTHRSGVLSAVFLALSFPPLGHRLVSEGIRLAHIGTRPRHYASHFSNTILGALAGARDITNILRERFLSKPRKPGFLVRNKAGKYALHYHAEQEPDPESRIVLSDETDRFGLPRAIIDFRFTDNDVNSVIASHQVLDDALRASGIGRLEYRYPVETLPDRVRAQAADGYHQAGTTRMGRDTKSSVVDADLKVHGVENLYIASSSVFPTTGQANSTFPAVALGLRLVHHLAKAADQYAEKAVAKNMNAP